MTISYVGEKLAMYVYFDFYMQVDIFSLGMVIYELTTLHGPFDDMSSLQANQAIESGVRPPLCRKVNKINDSTIAYFLIL